MALYLYLILNLPLPVKLVEVIITTHRSLLSVLAWIEIVVLKHCYIILVLRFFCISVWSGLIGVKIVLEYCDLSGVS